MSQQATLRNISRKLTKESKGLHYVMIPSAFASPVYTAMFVGRMLKLHRLASQLHRALYPTKKARKAR